MLATISVISISVHWLKNAKESMPIFSKHFIAVG
jgi:hypothetical protein